MNGDEGKEYFYSGGKRVPLFREKTAYAVKFKLGERSESSSLSIANRRFLREESKFLQHIPNYNIYVYQVQSPSLAEDPGELEEVISKKIISLDEEDVVEYASPAYKNSPESMSLVITTKRFIAQFKPEVTQNRIEELNSRFGVKIIEKLGYAENCYLLEAPSSDGESGAISLANKYYESGYTIFSNPDLVHRVSYKSEVSSELVPRSVFLSQQWHLATAKVTEAWNITKGTSSIRIAILDDGIDTSHPEFKNKIFAQHNFATNTSDGNPNGPDDKHGTACAGVATAAGVKAFGSAPNCSLIAVKTPNFLSTNDEALMFDWTMRAGADVISCSWGPPDNEGPFPLFDSTRAAINTCVTSGRGGKGIPIFFAAGNGNELVSDDGYAANPDVIAVAASTDQDTKAWYSDLGPEIWICAPSSGGQKRIFTTDRLGSPGYNSGSDTLGDPVGDYTNNFGGTSSATPLVAGIAGLMLSLNPNLTKNEIKEIFKRTSDKIGSSSDYDMNGHSRIFGYGRVNALRALQSSASGTGPGGGGSQPSITGPENTSRSGTGPSFQVDRGGRIQYAIEVATQANLFDNANNGNQRNSNNFYASWKDGLFFTASSYTLPFDVWSRLKSADRLFYRAQVADDGQWTNHAVTVNDSQWQNAPSVRITASPGGGGGGGVQRTVTYPSGATFNVIDSPQDGIDYSDPVANGSVPLIEVTGRLDEHLSANFTVKEFAARRIDSHAVKVRYARISPELVTLLQRLREHTGLPVSISSGYRYPALNTHVGGAAQSQHMAGKAADIKIGSQTQPQTLLQMASSALEVMGCDIGIGLGGTTGDMTGRIHVDVRGRRSSYVYASSNPPMTEEQFDRWVEQTCSSISRFNEDSYPTINGPETVDVRDNPPAFYITLGDNRYYAVEVTTDWSLFDSSNKSKRDESNFYGSWINPLQHTEGDSTQYRLPMDVWKNLRNAHILYYRVITSSNSTWVNPLSSVAEGRLNDAPYFKIKGHLTPHALLPEVDVLSELEARENDEKKWKENMI